MKRLPKNQEKGLLSSAAFVRSISRYLSERDHHHLVTLRENLNRALFNASLCSLLSATTSFPRICPSRLSSSTTAAGRRRTREVAVEVAGDPEAGATEALAGADADEEDREVAVGADLPGSKKLPARRIRCAWRVSGRVCASFPGMKIRRFEEEVMISFFW